MSSDQKQTQQKDSQQQGDEQQGDRAMTEKPEVQEEHKKVAKEMMKEYDEDRPTVAMPGSDGTVAGTAVSDWLDDDGNPKYSDESKSDSGGKDDGGPDDGGRDVKDS
jgi:hypothetical protein